MRLEGAGARLLLYRALWPSLNGAFGGGSECKVVNTEHTSSRIRCDAAAAAAAAAAAIRDRLS